MAQEIPLGSTVLITGVTGYIASHIADQVVAAGFRVRGTTRSADKAKPLQAVIDKKYGAGKLEIYEVKDLSKAGAFDGAVKDVSGVIHVASNLSFDPDPNKVIPETVQGIRSILESSAKQPSVKRFVYTSSSTATAAPRPNVKFTVDKDSWNDEQVEEAWKPAPYEASRAWAVYGASKTLGEQEVWKFVREEKPKFIANAVLPNANFGPLLYQGQSSSTGGWVFQIYDRDVDSIKSIPPQWFVDVRDTAALHLIALTSADVANERVFAYSEPYTYPDIVRIIQSYEPGWVPPEGLDTKDQDLSQVAGRERAASLLKGLGRDGFITLQKSVTDALSGPR